MNRLVKHDLVRGLKDVVFEKDKLGSSCQAGKQVGIIVYGFVIVDDYTRYTWVFFLVDKSDVFATFKSFVKGIHNEFETTIKRVRK